SSEPFILRAPRAARTTQVFLRAWERARVPIQNGRNSTEYNPRGTPPEEKRTARTTPTATMTTPISRRFRVSFGPILTSSVLAAMIESYRGAFYCFFLSPLGFQPCIVDIRIFGSSALK